MAQTQGFDIFISYSSRDEAWVKQVVGRLDQAGLRTWFACRDLLFGQNFQEALERALERSTAVAVFVGERGISSWMQNEVRAAINNAASQPHRTVFYVLIPTCLLQPEELPLFLRNNHGADLRSGLDALDVDLIVKSVRAAEQGTELIADSTPPSLNAAEYESALEKIEASLWDLYSRETLHECERLLAIQDSARVRWALAALYVCEHQPDLARRHLVAGDALWETPPPNQRKLVGGIVAQANGDLKEAEDQLRAFLGADTDGLTPAAVAYDKLGQIVQNRGRLDETAKLLRKSIRIKRDPAVADRFGQCITSGRLGRLALHLRNSEEAVRRFRDRLALTRELGDTKALGTARTELAEALLDFGQSDEAAELFRETMEDDNASQTDIGFALLTAAEMELLDGEVNASALNLASARESLEKVLSTRDGGPAAAGLLLADEVEGLIALHRGWTNTAAHRFRFFEESVRKMMGPLFLSYRLRRRAQVAAHAGDVALVRRILDEVDKLAIGDPGLPIDVDDERDELERLAQRLAPPSAAARHWLRYWRGQLPQPLARALPVDELVALTAFSFAERLTDLVLAITGAQLSSTEYRTARWERMRWGDKFAVLRDAVGLLHHAGQEHVCPDIASVLADVNLLVESRNKMFHPEDRGGEPKPDFAELLPGVARLTRYAADNLRLEVRGAVGRSVPLRGVRAHVPQTGSVSLVLTDHRLELGDWLRIEDGGFVWSGPREAAAKTS